MRVSTRDDVKKLAQSIESLAREVQSKLDGGGDVLPTANELIRNNLTLVFALGEVSASEHDSKSKKVRVKVVKKSKNTSVSSHNYQNYYRVRNSSGRFVAKK